MGYGAVSTPGLSDQIQGPPNALSTGRETVRKFTNLAMAERCPVDAV